MLCPIHLCRYYASNLARKCMKQYQQSVNDMNESIRNRPNPFKFQHISYLKSINQFDDSGPSVVLATPGMLQNGLSRDLFEAWCQDSKNGLIIAGYTVEGTLGKEVMNEPDTIKTMTGQTVPRRMEVSTISFAAYKRPRHHLNPPLLRSPSTNTVTAAPCRVVYTWLLDTPC